MRSRLLVMHSAKEWLALLLVMLLLTFVLPVFNVALPAESSFHVPDYVITLLGKFMCYGIVALAMDLIWGFTGILSLGHGVFFALGGYACGMHMMRIMAGEGVYKSDLPDFMVFLDWQELPWFWQGFQNFYFAMLMALLIPGLLAFVFGFFAFRSRIRGVYLSIITQAMTFAAMLWFFRNDTGFGGNNGLTDFKRVLGFSLAEPSTKLGLYVVSVLALALSYLSCRYLVSGRFGSLIRAIRDEEGKVMFTGYNPLHFKLFVWTLSAMLCGFAGALYVPQVGIINPSEMEPANSIEMAIWVAVGGRATLIGAPIGAWVVNGAKSWFTAEFPDYWLYVLGALFVGVTLFLPQGIVGSIIGRLRRRHVTQLRGGASQPEEVGAPAALDGEAEPGDSGNTAEALPGLQKQANV